jgi:hypothetical protein
MGGAGLRLHIPVRAAARPAKAVQNRSYDFVEPTLVSSHPTPK